MITGIRIGTNNSSALHHEWKKQGQWQEPIELLPNEIIVGIRGQYGLGDSIKSIGFVLMTFG